MCEYVIVTEELNNKAELSKPSLRAEGIAMLGMVPANLIEGLQLPLRNHERRREKKAKDSAATNQ